MTKPVSATVSPSEHPLFSHHDVVTTEGYSCPLRSTIRTILQPNQPLKIGYVIARQLIGSAAPDATGKDPDKDPHDANDDATDKDPLDCLGLMLLPLDRWDEMVQYLKQALKAARSGQAPQDEGADLAVLGGTGTPRASQLRAAGQERLDGAGADAEALQEALNHLLAYDESTIRKNWRIDLGESAFVKLEMKSDDPVIILGRYDYLLLIPAREEVRTALKSITDPTKEVVDDATNTLVRTGIL